MHDERRTIPHSAVLSESSQPGIALRTENRQGRHSANGTANRVSSAAKTRCRAGCARAMPAQQPRHALTVMPKGGWRAWRIKLRTRGAAAASEECRRRRFPTRATIIPAQEHQMLRSDRARSSTTYAHDSTAVRVCMARRLGDNSDALRTHGGLLYDPALLQAPTLHDARENCFLAMAAAGHVRAAWPAARKRPARALGRAPAAHCTVCRTVCAWVFQLCARQQVRVTTFACMHVCVTGLGSGSGAVREQLRDLWFGLHGS